MTARRFESVLVANRGEIAVRVIRTLRTMGIRSVAVFSDADAGSRHALLADAAIRIGPAEPRASYLSVDAVVAAAKKAAVDAVHPGYGFLSERADFARALETAGIAFVGPPADVLEGTGDKLGVKARVAAAGVPVVPGPLGPVGESDDALRAAAKETGYPLLLKAVGGGGGKGMREVASPADLLEAAASARREASAAFADVRLYAEALITGAQHVEVQVLCDAQGEVQVLSDRDCSLQRRHQKVIEEAPAPGLSEKTRAALHRAAADAARALGYRNAGTVEFLVAPDGRAYFLEVNRRLQVEHPVTEAVLGLDLVARQVRVAQGERLPDSGWTPHGHAVEARVCAEDPAHGFVPSPGPLLYVVEPQGPGVRVDSGFATGGEVPPNYDSLLMKVIAWGETRDEAIARLDAALSDTHVLGVRTNTAFLRRCLASPAFREAKATVDFLDSEAGRVLAASPAAPQDAVLAAAVAEALGAGGAALGAGAPAGGERPDPWRSLSGWRDVP
jgi:acetyl-CoA/propionyl-CoA carboxylase biotin carboxyl carrier protein